MKLIIGRFSLCLATALLITTSLQSAAAPSHTGIQGQSFLYISYGTPIEVSPGVWIGIPSVQLPIATSFTVLSAHNRREVARVTTDANGLYSVSLPPGRYVLVPDAVNLSPFANCGAATQPIEVTVQAKQFTLANIFYFRQGPCAIFGAPIQLGTHWLWAIPFGGVAGNQNFFAVPATPVQETTGSETRLLANQGHHQSGITGRVSGGVIIATPTGEGSRVIPDIVRVYSDSGELVAEVETEVEGNAWWHFQINLKPGNYTVIASVPGGYSYSYPVSVTVDKKQFTEVNLGFLPV